MKIINDKNYTAVVTGSTQGLGENICRKLISIGLPNLIICGRNKENGERLCVEFNKLGTNTTYVKADLLNISDCEKIINTAKNKYGRIDVLVNSAGMTDRGGLFSTAPNLFDDIFAVNVRAPFFLMKGAADIMIRQKIKGNIINIISMTSYGGTPSTCTYSASKGALMTLTKNVAQSLAQYHIRVNGLNIGWMDSPGENELNIKNNKGKDWKIEASKKQPFKRLLSMKEIADAVAFIINPDSIMTGSIIDYDQHIMGILSSY